MKLLVTGAAGFIGSNFVRHVLRERPGVRIAILDALDKFAAVIPE